MIIPTTNRIMPRAIDGSSKPKTEADIAFQIMIASPTIVAIAGSKNLISLDEGSFAIATVID